LERTVAQLLVSSVVLLPYVILTTQNGAFRPEFLPLLLLLVVGIVHTGVAYALYFHAVGALPAQTAALLSYLDPVLAVLLSALLLREPMSWSVALGAVLILGSTLISELKPNSK
jgi:drug/metabolite transporter (DMT)-like permease